MKYVFILSLVAMLCACQTEITEADLGAKTEFSIYPIYKDGKEVKDPFVFDAGEVVKGEIIYVEFKMTNEGEIPLIINKIRPGCGCTNTTDAPRNPIAPGDSYVLKAEVNTATLSNKGKIKKNLRLDANVTPYPLELFITADLK